MLSRVDIFPRVTEQSGQLLCDSGIVAPDACHPTLVLGIIFCLGGFLWLVIIPKHTHEDPRESILSKRESIFLPL